MSFRIVNTQLAAALAPTGTFAVTLPAGTDLGRYFNAQDAFIVTTPANDKYSNPKNFTMSFSGATLTITSVNMTLAAGTNLSVQIPIRGPDDGVIRIDRSVENVFPTAICTVNLGAPIATVANNVCLSQSPGAGAILLNGAAASGGVATLDRPRNLIYTSGGNDSGITFTAAGKDEFGVAMTETVTGANATVANGKKAFKTVSSIVASGAVATTLTVGVGNVLGLPVFLPKAGHILKELQDGVAPTAGTTVAGVTSVASATTGDVRGTYVPNVAPDATKTYELILALNDPTYRGIVQA